MNELTKRENQVLGLVTEGLSNPKIGKRLGVSVHTVKFHLRNACIKLGTDSRVKAAVTFALHRTREGAEVGR